MDPGAPCPVCGQEAPRAGQAAPPGQGVAGAVPAAVPGSEPVQVPAAVAVPESGAAAPGSGRRRLLLGVALVAGFLLVAGSTFLVVRSAKADPDRETLRVELVAAGEPGPDPFTEPVATMVRADFRTTAGSGGGAKTSPGGNGGAKTSPGANGPGEGKALRVATTGGTRAGLYGSVASDDPGAICQAEKLEKALADDPAVAAAWADAMGIETSRIGATIDELTPVVLGGDTLVTNSAYQGGEAARFPAILQAGTPVFVDRYGAPRVQCSCGNPLGAATVEATDEVTLAGPRWEDFDERRVTGIERAEQPVTELETIDIDSNGPATVAVGPTTPAPDTVELDGLLVLDDAGVHVVGNDGTRTTLVDHEVAAAYDDGQGGLVYQDVRATEDASGSWPYDLAARPPASVAEATIWHLAAGADEPVALLSTEDPARSWPGLMAAGVLGDRAVVAYAAATFDPGASEESQLSADLVIRDLESGEDTVVEEQVWGYEGGADPVEITPERFAYEDGYGTTSWDVYDTELSATSNACLRDDEGIGCSDEAGAVDAEGRLVSYQVSDSFESVSALRVVDLDTGADIGRFSNVASENIGGGDYSPYLDAWDGDVILSFRPAAGVDPAAALRFDLDGSPDQEPEVIDVGGQVQILRAPLVRPAGGAETAPPPTTTTSTTTSTTTTTAAPPTTTPPTTTPPPPTTAVAAEWPSFTGQGLGPLQLGMSVEEAKATGWPGTSLETCAALLGGGPGDGNELFELDGPAVPPGLSGSVETTEGRVSEIHVAHGATMSGGVRVLDGWDPGDVDQDLRAAGYAISYEDLFEFQDLAQVTSPSGDDYEIFFGPDPVVGIPLLSVCD